MPNVVPKSAEQCSREYAAEIVRLARLAFDRLCSNVYSRLYLAGTRRVGLDTHNPTVAIWERLTVATAEEIDAREELFSVNPEPVPINMTQEQLWDWFRAKLNREPLWIFAD